MVEIAPFRMSQCVSIRLGSIGILHTDAMLEHRLMVCSQSRRTSKEESRGSSVSPSRPSSTSVDLRGMQRTLSLYQERQEKINIYHVPCDVRGKCPTTWFSRPFDEARLLGKK